MKLNNFTGSVGLLIVIAAADYVTSYELNLAPFYLAPISMAAWFSGRLPGWIMACTAATVWFLIGKFSGHPYTHDFYRFWDVGARWLSFALVATLVASLRQTLDTAKQLATAKDTSLRELMESTIRLRQLEGSFQTICAWTNQIKDGDDWISFPEFLERHMNIATTHGISPQGEKIFISGLPNRK